MTKKKTETIVMSYESTSGEISNIKKNIKPVEEPAPVKKTGSTRKKKSEPVEEPAPVKKIGTTRKKNTKPVEEDKPAKKTRNIKKKRVAEEEDLIPPKKDIIDSDVKSITSDLTDKKVSEEPTPLTPSEYFHKIKGMMNENSPENTRNLIANAMTLMKKPLITGQTKMAEDIYTVSKVLLKELKAVEKGFTTYVKKDDLLYYIDKVAHKVAKIIDIQNYEREIPDDVFEKLIEAKDVFDEFLIVFTDYTGESERKIEKKKRDKDPILFGVFKMNAPGEKTTYFGRLYFIGDWVDDYCDLTLDKMIEEYKAETGKDITNAIHPDMTVDDIRMAIDTLKYGTNTQALPKEGVTDEL